MESEIPKAKQPTKHRAKVCTWYELYFLNFKCITCMQFYFVENAIL